MNSAPPTEPQRATITMKELATMLGVAPNTVAAAVRRGEIPSVQIGRRRLVPRAKVIAWLDGGTEAVEPQPVQEASPQLDRTDIIARVLRTLLDQIEA